MIWKNPGHELDDIGNKYLKVKKSVSLVLMRQQKKHLILLHGLE